MNLPKSKYDPQQFFPAPAVNEHEQELLKRQVQSNTNAINGKTVHSIVHGFTDQTIIIFTDGMFCIVEATNDDGSLSMSGGTLRICEFYRESIIKTGLLDQNWYDAYDARQAELRKIESEKRERAHYERLKKQFGDSND